MKKPAFSLKESSSELASKSKTGLEVDDDWGWMEGDEEGDDSAVEVEVDSVGLEGEKVEMEGKLVVGIAFLIDSLDSLIASLDSLASLDLSD